MRGFGSKAPPLASPGPLESVTPADSDVTALTDSHVEARVLSPTIDLPPVGFKPPATLAEAVSGGGSAAGFSAVSSWLNCPEQARLRSLGVSRRPDNAFDKGKLDALTMGTLAHAMRATRLAYGHLPMLYWFWHTIGLEIPKPDADKLDLIFRIYESVYPLNMDTWRILGIEVEVVTDIDGVVGPSIGRPVYRTVRYDTVIAHPDGGVYSWEAKTAARKSNLEQHNPQCMVQTAVWNANASLVAKYGRMRGVLFDEYVKTETPSVERVGPRYFSVAQQRLALRYMMLPELMQFPVGWDGRYPQHLHACWGKYSPCAYIPLCHEDAQGEYVLEDGSDYVG